MNERVFSEAKKQTKVHNMSFPSCSFEVSFGCFDVSPFGNIQKGFKPFIWTVGNWSEHKDSASKKRFSSPFNLDILDYVRCTLSSVTL